MDHRRGHPDPRNIYSVTKLDAEDLCELFARREGLPCLILRASRFFPKPDDSPDIRQTYDDANTKVNEYLYRRVDLEDAVEAHLRALERAAEPRFGRDIISATTPFTEIDLPELGIAAPAVLARHIPDYAEEYQRPGWTMFPTIDRVYDNTHARSELGWQPRHDFRSVLEAVRHDEEHRSALAGYTTPIRLRIQYEIQRVMRRLQPSCEH